jgi:hypothetical protein
LLNELKAFVTLAQYLEAEMLASEIASSILGAGQVKFARCVLAATISALCVANAKAVPITYTESATISGFLGGVSFTNQLLTLTGTGDTTAISSHSVEFDNLVTVTFSVAGIGSGSLTDPSFFVFDNQGAQLAGFFLLPPGVDLLDTTNAIFSSYALATAIGPVTGSSTFNTGGFHTSVGTLIITSAGNATFAAVGGVPAVPIPGALPLFATGLGALGLLGWRRKWKAAAHAA